MLRQHKQRLLPEMSHMRADEVGEEDVAGGKRAGGERQERNQHHHGRFMDVMHRLVIGPRRAVEGEEKQAFLHDMGLEEAGLDRLIRSGYELLGLITYFTAGVKEVRAWTIVKGTKAPQAAPGWRGESPVPASNEWSQC